MPKKIDEANDEGVRVDAESAEKFWEGESGTGGMCAPG
jgi:hypothetical protein